MICQRLVYKILCSSQPPENPSRQRRLHRKRSGRQHGELRLFCLVRKNEHRQVHARRAEKQRSCNQRFLGHAPFFQPGCPFVRRAQGKARDIHRQQDRRGNHRPFRHIILPDCLFYPFPLRPTTDIVLIFISDKYIIMLNGLPIMTKD